jgi:hypothetical protein
MKKGEFRQAVFGWAAKTPMIIKSDYTILAFINNVILARITSHGFVYKDGKYTWE